MVKNTHGGKKTKGFSRKSGTASTSSSLRLSNDDNLEMYAQVSKLLGGSMCHVHTLRGEQLICCIRGKFRYKRNQWSNKVARGTWVLVGKREWDNLAKKDSLATCDLLEVYNESDKARLKNSLYTIDWSPFIAVDNSESTTKTQHTDVEFMDDVTEDYYELLNKATSSTNPQQTTTTISTLCDCDDMGDVDFDDL